MLSSISNQKQPFFRSLFSRAADGTKWSSSTINRPGMLSTTLVAGLSFLR
jgi:hypothetical protein